MDNNEGQSLQCWSSCRISAYYHFAEPAFLQKGAMNTKVNDLDSSTLRKDDLDNNS